MGPCIDRLQGRLPQSAEGRLGDEVEPARQSIGCVGWQVVVSGCWPEFLQALRPPTPPERRPAIGHLVHVDAVEVVDEVVGDDPHQDPLDRL